MTTTDFYDHVTFIIPPGEQISELTIDALDISDNLDIVYRIQQDTSGVYPDNSDYVASHISPGDLSKNILELTSGPFTGLHELKGGYPSGTGIRYSLLLYLNDNSYNEVQENFEIF